MLGVIGPHNDDVPLSCSQLVAANPGAHILTIFGGGPGRVDPIPIWETHSRLFRPGDDVIGIRRLEAEDSCAALHATSHCLPFWDEQYRVATYGYRGPHAESLVEAIGIQLNDAIRGIEADLWVVPLGILHADHQIVGRACRSLITRSALPVDWLIYEELPYRLEYPDQLERAQQIAKEDGVFLEPVEPDVNRDLAKKRSAIRCHRSQLRVLGARLDLAVNGPEKYYRPLSH